MHTNVAGRPHPALVIVMPRRQRGRGVAPERKRQTQIQQRGVITGKRQMLGPQTQSQVARESSRAVTKPTRVKRFPDVAFVTGAEDLTYRKLSFVFGTDALPVRLG